MPVIGLHGVAKSGKNTAAGILTDMLSAQGNIVLVMPFAAALKRFCTVEHGWNGEKDDAGRTLLQNVGESERQKYLDVWLDPVVEVYDRLRWIIKDNIMGMEPWLIIPDARNENELSWISTEGSVWMLIGRGGLQGEHGKHVSEQPHVEFVSKTIPNNATKSILEDHLEVALKEFMEVLKSK